MTRPMPLTARMIMDNLKLQGYETEAPLKDIRKIILLTAGGKEATVSAHFRYLQEIGYITKTSNGVFLLHHAQVK